jgi:hypothetical protein
VCRLRPQNRTVRTPQDWISGSRFFGVWNFCSNGEGGLVTTTENGYFSRHTIGLPRPRWRRSRHTIGLPRPRWRRCSTANLRAACLTDRLMPGQGRPRVDLTGKLAGRHWTADNQQAADLALNATNTWPFRPNRNVWASRLRAWGQSANHFTSRKLATVGDMACVQR